ncbi:MAG: LPS assembly protein LptD, partial [Proteobacteria bacterium]|nr:LPS assembly protein LptD [Pseudomonadota bacterium]
MKQRLLFVSVALLALLCLSAGQPWLLFGDLPRQNEQQLYAEGPDLTFSQAPRSPEDKGKWTFTADSISADHDAEYVEAQGECTFTDGENTLRADFARYYKQTGWVILKGNVRALWVGDFLEAEEAEFDLTTMLGWLKNGKVFVTKAHRYLESEYINKYKGDSYSFKNAKVTSCGGDKPAWSLTAEEGDITLDGYAKLWHTAFRIRDTPVAYLPYMQIPASGKRQSGFLMPELSSSNRFGFGVTQPYYWVVNDEMDMTFYQNFMSARGYRQGLELRHTNNAHTKGYWRFDWLNDSRVIASTNDDEDDSLLGDDGLLRPNRNRWWWRSKFNGYLGVPSWRVMVDLDLASDQDYLKEFSKGFLGYKRSHDEMLDEFGRDINPADDPVRTNVALLTRDYDSFGVAGKLEYNQNLEYWNGNAPDESDPTLQTLPELGMFTFKDSLLDTPLEFENTVEFDAFHRNWGTKGQRLRVNPEVSLPLKTDFLTFIPTIGMESNFYNVDRWQTDGNQTLAGGQTEGNNTAEDSNPTSLALNAGFTMFSELSRVYPSEDPALELNVDNVGQSRWESIKHSIVPRVSYDYQPRRTGQTDKPYFDEQDRFFGQNELTYSLTNVLDRKRQTVTLSGDGTPSLASDYLDFARLRIEQSFDNNEATRKDSLDEYKRRPFSDILAEVMISPFGGLSLMSKAFYSPYLSKITENETTLGYTFVDGSNVFLGYDFLDTRDEYKYQIRDKIQVLRLGGNYNIARNLVLGLEYRRDLHQGLDLEKTIKLSWTDDCYEV